MITHDPIQLTHGDLRSANSDDRARLLEEYLLAVIASLRPPDAANIDSSAHLADLGVDSLQVVELKFNLDQLLGEESDVAIIIANPTIRELALHSVRSSRALT